MNICITINSLVDGGAEKQSLLLAKALQSHYAVALIILNPEPIYAPHHKIIEEENINHVFLSKNPVKKYFEFISFIKKNKIDVIFSFLPADTLWAAICGKITGVPYVFGGIRNSHITRPKFAALRFANNYLLNYTIANNFAAYASSIKFGFRNKVFVIANGIEIRPILQRDKTDSKIITIISVGRLVKQKRYDTALKTIFELKNSLDKNFRLHYRIVGSGPEEDEILADIEKFKLQNEAQIIKNPPNVYELLESSDIYLCTSSFEGISNSIMEAMNCALPVVATDAGDNSRLVINEKNGFIAKIEDYKTLAAHLGNLVKSLSMREQMGLEGYNHLMQNFGYEAFQKKYLGLLDKITEIQIKDGELQTQTQYSNKTDA
ncbi:Glycosyltransferase involved in cell wall bisynthesis [Pricia antarctica]|uniref:Glycosyltransferase involved in cell wall bisynthesis n=1 Tax=Pricia antarctica TaxID=641691 RepID=A0A1G6YQ69_9FLAO|nr:glycosyltransferase family 4 protein [Pricia antarctica]SDD92549.1 Glycosyltransferase involved in cell wall bisynthesis [Pricia antarctica]